MQKFGPYARTATLAVALAASLAGCAFMGAPPAPKPAPRLAAPPAPPPRLKVMAFYDQTAGQAAPPNPLALLKSHPGLVTELAPFWYKVEPTGSVVGRPQDNLPALAQQQHLPLVPLFNNAQGNDTFLKDPAARSRAVNAIAGLVRTHRYAGVNIDFQGLSPADRQDLTTFMDALARALPKGSLLSMSVVPLKTTNGSQSAYDYRALDHIVGAMVLMAYDLHGDGTPPGPVSPIRWVSRAIYRARQAGVEASKLYLGIANYGYDWPEGSSKATTVPLKVMHAYRYGHYRYVPRYQEATTTYVSHGVKHVIWFVPDRGAVARIRLAERYHLAGVAFWRVGYEDERWWNAVAAAVMHRPVAAVRPHHSPQHKGTGR
ncbi:MAG: glycoside hydrolase [Actinomycetia bacterium]|nr:glycoside hydrolase [Actinomycetes bacterium]